MQLGLPLASGDRSEGISGPDSPNSFGEDAACNLYVMGSGEVDRIVSSNPPAVAPACTAPAVTKKCKRHKHKKHKKHAASAKKKHKKKQCKKKRKHKKKK